MSSPSPQVLLRTERLCKSFGSLLAVKEVSLDIRAGEIHAIIGPNGAGKTTLLNVMSGELLPTIRSRSITFRLAPLPAPEVEKYLVALGGLSVLSWMMIRWSDDPDGPRADRLLVLVAYLSALGYANHMAGALAVPAIGLAVLIRRPRTIFRLRLLAAVAGVVVLGMTPFATQPIRAAFFPAIHFRPVEFPGLFVCGLILGTCALRTGRLGMGIAAHMAFNATGLLLVARI